MKEKNLREREIRKIVYSLDTELTDKEFFTNNGFKMFLVGGVNALLIDSQRKIELNTQYSKSTVIAFTDNQSVYINLDNYITRTMPSRKDKYLSVLGLIYHEIGHVLYTDFTYNTLIEEQLNNHDVWFPAAVVDEYDVMAKLKKYPVLKELFLKLFRHIDNTIEDAYIENKMKARFSGGVFEQGLNLVNSYQKNSMPPLKELLCEEYSPLNIASILIDACLDIAKYDYINGLDDESLDGKNYEAYKREISTIREKITSCRFDSNIDTRKKVGLEISLQIFKYVLEEFGDLPDDLSEKGEIRTKEEKSEGETDEAESSHTDIEIEIPDEIEKIFEDIDKKGTAIPKGDTKPISDSDFESEDEKEFSEATDYDELCKSVAEEVYNSAEEKRLKREAKEIFVRVSNTLKGEYARDSSYDNMVMSKSYSVANSVCLSVMKPEYANKQNYTEIYSGLQAYSKAFEKLLAPVLKERETDSYLEGLYSGTRISNKKLYRNDGRIFQKRLVADGRPDMAVCLLIDESGSMRDSKEEVARNAAILLDDVLNKLQITHCVIGHSGDIFLDSSLDLFSYINFDDFSGKNSYKLTKITARGQNRDGQAIAYCCERLLKRPEKQKILFVISDGEPLAYGYEGTFANDDVKYTVERYKKRGVKITSLGIGYDIDESKHTNMYGRNFLMVQELSTLPLELTKLLKREIL